MATQVSTEPKMSMELVVGVVEPVVEMVGGPDLYIRVGSPVRLTCLVTQFLIPPTAVTWWQAGLELPAARYTGLQAEVDTGWGATGILTSLHSRMDILQVRWDDPYRLNICISKNKEQDMMMVTMITSMEISNLFFLQSSLQLRGCW